MPEWPENPCDPRDVEGGHFRPLSAAEFLQEIQRVYCPQCQAESSFPCVLDLEDRDLVSIETAPGEFGFYHGLREERAERKVGL